MYILIDKNTNKVAHTSNKKLISYGDNLILAEVETLPAGKYDYLIAADIREVITEDGFSHTTCTLIPQSKPIDEAIVAKQKAIKEIAALKQKLADTDYQAIKYAEGCYTEEEYAPIKAQRQAWRNKINELQN